MKTNSNKAPHPSSQRSWWLTLSALGVVFGDIGTSPLYTFHTALQSPIVKTADFPLGVASLIIWSLLAIVTGKYVFLVMRADYHGEGGLFALLALIGGKKSLASNLRLPLLTLLILFGAALLYGDGAITPAISVLSSVEGLQNSYPSLTLFILPLTALILVVLFSVQHLGTGRLGIFFGGIMLVWFLTLGILGAFQIVHTPSVLAALNPCYAWKIIQEAKFTTIFLLSSIVLAITGVEALYADMGHFGRKTIARAWNFIVLPCLILNYLGQAAIAKNNPSAWKQNVFFELIPHGPLSLLFVGLATVATVIASQALISGVFSLTAQARDLGCLPRFLVIHTNRLQRGQVYLPTINWLLAIICLLLVFSFRSSTNLAAAYGLAVIGTMIITSIAFSVTIVRVWNYPRWIGACTMAALLMLELPFLFSSLTKFAHGGCFPLLIAAVLVGIMTTWHRGRCLIRKKIDSCSLEKLASIMSTCQQGLPGTDVIIDFNSHPNYAAAHALELIRLRGPLRKQVILLTPVGTAQSYVPLKEGLKVTPIEPHLWHIIFYYGYMQEINMPHILKLTAPQLGYEMKEEETFFLLPRETIVEYRGKEMRRWQRALFGWLSRNMSYAPNYFFIPASQIIDFTWIMRV
ncbi:MAG: KUP/HAK/KT family potassium transporter [Chthoniobacterales bacterium]|nr:KUP/HAK/KT family potassium transporter [Chthoniobacterales bacterium]